MTHYKMNIISQLYFYKTSITVNWPALPMKQLLHPQQDRTPVDKRVAKILVSSNFQIRLLLEEPE